MDFKKVENELKELLSKFDTKLDSDIIIEINNLIHSGEYGVALEEFNNMLYEYDIVITNEEYNAICNLCKIMNINVDEWSFLKELIK